jgi:protocatechuate 3,4-dioxygenase beta subunit
MLASGICIIPQGNRMERRPMKTENTELNQLQVVVVLLAFGLLAGASGSAAAAVCIEGQVQASGSPLANSMVTLWQASARA